jgi:hypothetical protein
MALAAVQVVEWERAVNSASLIGWTVLATAHVVLAVAATASVSRFPLLDERVKARWVLGAWLVPLVSALWFVVVRRALVRRRRAVAGRERVLPG